MPPSEVALLVGAGLFAGVVNSLAGGGSLLTVSLLVLLGFPGTLANGTNRVGILVQNAVAAWRFRAEGVPGAPDALPLLVPVLLGSAVGAWGISSVADETFERLFGLLMIALLVPILRQARPRAALPRRWSRPVVFAVFLAIGLYGGAFQAGVGIPLLFALSFAGHDLVRANSIKVVVVFAVTAVAIPVFVAHDQIAWRPAAALAVGFFAGGELGARLAVRGGERVIRPVLAAAVLALAGRMLGLV
jgi:uncharacterized membrane protein YfcA